MKRYPKQGKHYVAIGTLQISRYYDSFDEANKAMKRIKQGRVDKLNLNVLQR